MTCFRLYRFLGDINCTVTLATIYMHFNAVARFHPNICQGVELVHFRATRKSPVNRLQVWRESTICLLPIEILILSELDIIVVL